MGIETVVRCDGPGCKVVIDSGEGFVVLGNIHKVGTGNVDGFEGVGGGIVGNNLTGNNEVFRVTYYCENCMSSVLELKQESSSRALDESE